MIRALLAALALLLLATPPGAAIHGSLPTTYTCPCRRQLRCNVLRGLLFLLAAALAWPVCAQPVTPQTITPVSIHGSPYTQIISTCPFGGLLPDSTSDGCVGSPPGGTIYEAAFFTEARQSGQTYYLSHPASWDIPCADYKCGPDLTHVATLGGSGAGGFRIPGTDALPTGCTYSGVTQRVTCTPTVATSCAATAQTARVGSWCILLDGWDYTTNGGMWLRVAAAAGNVAATVIIINNKFADGTFLDQDAAANGAGIVQADAAGCTAITATQSEFKRNMVTFPNPIWPFWLDEAGSGACAPAMVATYNYFQGTPEHTVRSNSSGTYYNAFNMAEGFGGKPGGVLYHASYINIEGNQSSVGAQSSINNAVLFDNLSESGTANISVFIEPAATISSFTANYNTLISNTNTGVATSSNLLETLPQAPATGVLTLFTAKGNLYDPSGSFGCLLNHLGGSQSDGTGIVTKALSGGIDIIDGSPGDIQLCHGHQ